MGQTSQSLHRNAIKRRALVKTGLDRGRFKNAVVIRARCAFNIGLSCGPANSGEVEFLLTIPLFNRERVAILRVTRINEIIGEVVVAVPP